MIVVEKVMTCFALFYPTALATAYGQRPKFFRAEHSATAEGENCAYGPTLLKQYIKNRSQPNATSIQNALSEYTQVHPKKSQSTLKRN